MHVCDVDREAVAQIGRSNPAITATCADVVNAAQIEAVFDAQKELFGGLDVLVNNAGIAGPTGGIDSITESEWMRTVDVNLNAQFRFARLAVPLLKESTQGHILCMSSVAGRLGYAWRTPYAATKWAILGLVKSLAAELGPCGIRVNALLPGFVEGERMDRVIRARAEQAQVDESRMRERVSRKDLAAPHGHSRGRRRSRPVSVFTGSSEHHGPDDQHRRKCGVTLNRVYAAPSRCIDWTCHVVTWPSWWRAPAECFQTLRSACACAFSECERATPRQPYIPTGIWVAQRR